MKTQINEIKRMQQLAGIVNEGLEDGPIAPLRIFSKKNSEGHEEFVISNPAGKFGEDSEVIFSKPEVEALHKLVEEWFKSEHSKFNRGISVNTPDENLTSATVAIKKLGGAVVEITRTEHTAGMDQRKGYDTKYGSGTCDILVSHMYQIREDKNLREAIGAPAAPAANAQPEKVQGSINLKLFQGLNIPDFNPSTFATTIGKVKAGTALSMIDNKILANTMTALIKTSDDALLGKIFANLKQIEAK